VPTVRVTSGGAALRAERTDDLWEVVSGDPAPDAAASRRLLPELLAAIAADGGGSVSWWVRAAVDADREVARKAGLHETRDVLQMRRRLPAADPGDFVTRAFRPGIDDEDWLTVNNRAFSWHPDQGGWDHEMLRARMAEPWFDPEDFLLHDIDGRMAGFCWTKLHADEEPKIGEIFVIAVDPDFSAQGLGRRLTLAGLDRQHRAHAAEVGMLYVEHDNSAAVALYESLGFTVHHHDRRFVGRV
jgi:mycothiol synthase